MGRTRRRSLTTNYCINDPGPHTKRPFIFKTKFNKQGGLISFSLYTSNLFSSHSPSVHGVVVVGETGAPSRVVEDPGIERPLGSGARRP